MQRTIMTQASSGLMCEPVESSRRHGNSHTVFKDVFELMLNRASASARVGITSISRTLNTRNRFWRDNRTVDELRNVAGCGHRLDHYPEIVALGGWSEEEAPAYKDLLRTCLVCRIRLGRRIGELDGGIGTLVSYMLTNGRERVIYRI